MKKRSFVLSLSVLLVLILPSLLFSEMETEQSKTIDHLIIHGLNRTKPSVVEKMLEPYIGIPVGKLDIAEVHTVLQESGLFYDAEVSLEYDDPASVALVVSVQEKWTLIPIPVILGDKNGIAGGGTLLETNAFGLNHKAFLAAFFSADRYTFFSSYMTPPGKNFPFGLATVAAFSNGETTVTDDSENELLSYDERDLTLLLGLNHDLNPLVSLSTVFGYRAATVDDSPVPSARMLPVSAEVRIGKSDWNGVFLSHRSVQIESSWSFALEGDSYPAFQGEFSWQQPVTSGLRIEIAGAAFHADDAPLVFYQDPSVSGTAILPADFRSSSLAGSSLGLEGRIIDFGAGMLTGFAFFQTAVAEDINSDYQYAWGPHFGIRCYLKKVAFPALDIGAAWNADSNIWNAGFSLGMQM